MQVIGLTGSIAAGKSATAHICCQLGLPVHDSDAYVHQLLGPRGAAVQSILTKFGSIGSHEAGIDRQALGKIVFSDAAAKSWLENELHPRVAAHRDQFMRQHRYWRSKIIVLDIPLLFEVGAEDICDIVITVWAPDFLRKQRALSRPHMTEERYKAIVTSQMPQTEKCQMSDFALPTGLGFADTRRRLKMFLKKQDRIRCAR